MKFVALLFMTLSAASAHAAAEINESKIVCVNRDLQDATLSATFTLGEKAEVRLFVPSGETSGERYTGECRSDEGAIEMALTCNVMTSTDSGYSVRLYSIGGPSLTASITPWSMLGKGETTSVPCDQ
jgi:hypothetical protein